MQLISKTRLEAFSDGVFAIIITLLVLEIKVPHIESHHSVEELHNALIALLPKFFSWIISFLIIAVIWVNHHRVLELVERVNPKFFWLNANLLLWASFIPFPTALLGDYSDNRLATVFFGVVLALSALAFVLIRWYLKSNPSILKSGISNHELSRALVKSVLFGPMLYLIGAWLSWINPFYGRFVYAVIPLLFIFPVIKPSTK